MGRGGKREVLEAPVANNTKKLVQHDQERNISLLMMNIFL